MFIFTPTNTISESDKNKIDSLTNVIDRINKKQTILENEIEIINDEVSKIDYNISKIRTNKTIVGKKYNEEIIRVNKYTDPQIDSFFSNRYK